MAARHAFDEAMQAQAPEVIGHRARRVGGRVATLELSDGSAKLAVAKPGRSEGKETEGVHEGVDASVAKPEPGGALLVDDDRLGHRVEGVFTDQAVVAQRFDV